MAKATIQLTDKQKQLSNYTQTLLTDKSITNRYASLDAYLESQGIQYAKDELILVKKIIEQIV